MTVSKLIKELEKLKKKHGPRTQVVVSKKGMASLGQEEWSHIGVQSATQETILWMIDDNWERKDGSERYKTVVTINGE